MSADGRGQHSAPVPGLVGQTVKVVGGNVTPKLSQAIAAFCTAFEMYSRVSGRFDSWCLLKTEVPVGAVTFLSFLITITIFFLLLHLTFLFLQSFPQANSKQSVFSQGLVCNITGYSSPLGKKRNVLFETVAIYRALQVCMLLS